MALGLVEELDGDADRGSHGGLGIGAVAVNELVVDGWTVDALAF